MPREELTGRRRPDIRFGDLPDDLQPGDYWKYLDRNMPSRPMRSDCKENLTGTCWGFFAPNGCGIGLLTKHTVREHPDGTISIKPNDGSSNSVLIHGAKGEWHGFVYEGVWKPV